MSENLTDSFHPQEKFQATNEISNNKEEANELFELINQLNDSDPFTRLETNQTDPNSNEKVEVEVAQELLNINVNTNEENDKHALLLINQTNTNTNAVVAPIESLIKPIEAISIQSNNTTTNTSDSKLVFAPENMNLSANKCGLESNCLSNLTNDATSLKQRVPVKSTTKIPRIPSLHKNENQLNSSVSDHAVTIATFSSNTSTVTNTTTANNAPATKIMPPSGIARFTHNIVPKQQETTSSSSTATSPTNSLTYKLAHELNKLANNTTNNTRHTRSASKPAGRPCFFCLLNCYRHARVLQFGEKNTTNVSYYFLLAG